MDENLALSLIFSRGFSCKNDYPVIYIAAHREVLGNRLGCLRLRNLVGATQTRRNQFWWEKLQESFDLHSIWLLVVKRPHVNTLHALSGMSPTSTSSGLSEAGLSLSLVSSANVVSSAVPVLVAAVGSRSDVDDLSRIFSSVLLLDSVILSASESSSKGWR